MSIIAKHYQKLLETIQKHTNYSPNLRIIAISKTQPLEKILDLHQSGQIVFGENRIQELREKKKQCPNTIDWHFVGSLQSNKAKYIPEICSYLHSLCSLEVANILEKKCYQLKKKLKVLIQMNLCQEKSKSGLLTYEDLQEFIPKILTLPNLELVGLMTIPSPELNNSQTGKIYEKLRLYQEKTKKEFLLENTFQELSMGMSNDYKIAITEGATMIRLGTILFGKREQV